MIQQPAHEPLAIVGIGCRFPGGVDSPQTFWKLLMDGVDAIVDIPPDRWDWKRYYDPDPDRPGKTTMRSGGFLTQPLDGFDARFFGVSPREAEQMDPQQRLLLEVSWEAMEDAGIPPDCLRGKPVGVYMGGFTLDAKISHFNRLNRHLIDRSTSTSATMTMLANRLSFVFDFRGPSITVDTACSSSLVAFHYACQDIWRGVCKTALAGGVNVMFRPEYAMTLSKGRFLAPDARCKTFDLRADGYGRGEGAGVVLIKPLKKAIGDGDRIYALVRGTGVNQDGRTDGITLPGQQSQETLLRQVYADADIAPNAIQYIEAHGTGTQAGDIIEACALGSVLGAGRSPDLPCIVGSVKTSIGHLEAAAGIAGLIKTALCLHHRTIPPNLHFLTPNPAIPFDDLRLRVPTRAIPWPQTGGPTLAGINSFGYGGTNGHALLEGWTAPEISDPSEEENTPEPTLLPLSARSEAGLSDMAHRYYDLLNAPPMEKASFFRDVVCAAALRRSHHAHRLALIASDRQAATGLLKNHAEGAPASGLIAGSCLPDSDRRLVFVYTGMGPQWWGMGRELYRTEPVYRDAVEQCDALFSTHAPWSLIDALMADEEANCMAEPEVVQSANLALQVGLTALWRSWGVESDAMVGHSVGEIAAVYASGAMSLDQAVKTSFHRGRILQFLKDRGKMLSTQMTEGKAIRLVDGLESLISIAGINSRTTVALSGDPDALEEMEKILTGQSVYAKFLYVNVAYHSYQLEPFREDALQSLADITFRQPETPLYSTVTGRRITGAVHDAAYWWDNLRSPVRFADAMDALIADGYRLFVEVGPHPVLNAYIWEALALHNVEGRVFASLRRKMSERNTMLEAAGGMYAAGRDLNWRAIYGGERRFVRLPTYPWQRERLFMESEASRQDRMGAWPHPLLGDRVNAPGYVREIELSGVRHPFLTDHRIQGTMVFPAAAYVEIALAADADLFGERISTVEALEFHAALTIEDSQPAFIRFQYDTDRQTFSIYARTLDKPEDWTLHASGRLLSTPYGKEIENVNPETLRGRDGAALQRDALYERLNRRGYGYGPRFRLIRELWSDGAEAFSCIEVPDNPSGEMNGYRANPGLLDAGFQTLIFAAGDSEEGLYLPVYISGAQYYRRPEGTLYACARIITRSGETLSGDMDLYDEKGALCMRVSGLQCRRIPNERKSGRTQIGVYDERWEKIDFNDQPSRLDRYVLVAEGIDAFSVKIKDMFARYGLLVSVRPDSESGKNGAGDRFTDISDMPPSGLFPNHTQSLVYLCPSSSSEASLPERGMALCMTVIRLIRTLAEIGEGVHLILVTGGAQTPESGAVPTDPASASLWGFMRTARLEYPGTAIRLVDTDGAEESLNRLPAVIAATEIEDELMIRAGAVYHRRLRRMAAREETAALSIPPDGYELEALYPGRLDSLRYRATERRPPGPGEIEIRVHTVALNFKDIMKVMGKLSDRILSDTFFGHALGMECSGTITAVGPDITEFDIGDEIIAVTGSGCFRSYLTVDIRQAYVLRRTRSLSMTEAPVLVPFLTVYATLQDMARVTRGERLLIHSATGGVGLAAIQYARSVGAEVFATAGSSEKRDYLKSLGIRHVGDSRTLAFAGEVMDWTRGKGVDVALNALSGDGLRKTLEIMAPYGRFIEIGKRDIDANTGMDMRPFNRNLTFSSFDGDRMLAECRERSERLIREVFRCFETGTFEKLPVEVFPADRVSDAFRHMAQARHIGKVMITLHEQTVPVWPGKSKRPGSEFDGTLLITGGTGGLGLETARWLVRQGARNLALVSRSGARTDEARQTVRELESQGVTVRVFQIDVSRRDEVKTLIRDVSGTMPPLKGIFHAAATLADGCMDGLNPSEFERVWVPKAAGAFHLHEETLNLLIEWFVLYSSFSVVAGNQGQASYTAANAFMDGLARHRRSLGLPATSVRWGAFGKAGMVARQPSVARLLETQGLRLMTPPVALDALLENEAREAACPIIADVDWTRWTESRRSSRWLVEDMLGSAAFSENINGAGTKARLDRLDQQTRRRSLQELIVRQTSEILRMAPEHIDIRRPLTEQGMDSLMGAELLAGVQMTLDVEITQMDLIKHNSVEDFTSLLDNRLSPTNGKAHDKTVTNSSTVLPDVDHV